MRYILKDIKPDDFVLAVRAIRALIAMGPQKKDVVMAYGQEPTKDFYVCRNKASITVSELAKFIHKPDDGFNV